MCLGVCACECVLVPKRGRDISEHHKIVSNGSMFSTLCKLRRLRAELTAIGNANLLITFKVHGREKSIYNRTYISEELWRIILN